MNKEAIHRLTALTAMMQDARLAALAQAEAARQATVAAMQRLDQTPVADGLDPIAEGLVQVGYARWADVRRKELGAILTKQSVACTLAQGAARTAFGRNQALLSVWAKMGRDAGTSQRP